jgi:hypothetical protein
MTISNLGNYSPSNLYSGATAAASSGPLINGGGNYTVEQCAAECTGFAECLHFSLTNITGTGSCEIYPAATFSSAGTVGWTRVYHKSGAPSRNHTYYGKNLTIAVAKQYGGAEQDSWNGNCGGFNHYFNNLPLNSFGTNYNGQCPNTFKLSYCPLLLGRPINGTYANTDGSPCVSSGAGCSGGDMNQNLQRKCDFAELDMSQFITAGQFNNQLGNQILQDSSWSQAKTDYCLIPANMDTTQCQGWYDTFGTASCDRNPNNCVNTSYNTAKLNACNTPSVIVTPSCVTTINNVMKSGLQSEQTTATGMVSAYCSQNSYDSTCGCYNVATYGSDCIHNDTKKNYAGCINIYNDYQDYQGIANSLIANKFCTSEDCITGAWISNTQFLPAARAPATTCPVIQACIQEFRGAHFINSDVTAECKQTLNLNTGGGSTPGPAPAPAPEPLGLPSSSSPASTSTSSSEPSTGLSKNVKIGVGILAIVLILLLLISVAS